MATTQVLARSTGPAPDDVDVIERVLDIAPPPTGSEPAAMDGEATGSSPHASAAGRYSLLLTRDSDLLLAAQRLRYTVFVGEQGARPDAADPIARATAAQRRDADAFDEHCDHLVVREDATGAIVGTYRMLTPEGALAAGGLYSDTEFDLGSLSALRPRTVEVGRSCVHPDHRNGVVLSLMWSCLGRYMMLTDQQWIVGCASVPLSAEGELPGRLWSLVAGRHLAPSERRVRPWRPAPIGPPDPASAGLGRAARAALPPLLRGYLRLGAEIGGPPALDPDFGVADLFVLLEHGAIDRRWRHYLMRERG